MSRSNESVVLKSAILQGIVSDHRLFQFARRKGWGGSISRKAIIGWLVDHGLSWGQYMLMLDPPMVFRIKICRFLCVRKGWKVLDVGCGMGGSTIAAASLVGREGKLVATDKSEEALRQTERLLRKLHLLDRVELKCGNVLDMSFEEDSFDIVLLLYTPQCLVGYHELVDILKMVRRWARLVGVVDHRAVPSSYAESVYTLFSWTEYDVGREIGAETLRLGFPFHEEEIKRALEEAGWRSIKDGSFPALVGSSDNAIPLSVMKDNLDLLESHAKEIKDCRSRELYISRIFAIKKLIEAQLPKLFFYAVLAGRDSDRKLVH